MRKTIYIHVQFLVMYVSPQNILAMDVNKLKSKAVMLRKTSTFWSYTQAYTKSPTVRL